MGRPSLRETILASGVRTLHEQGFAAAGIRDITAAAGVPQGSFTNHFASKEAFGVAVLDRYYDGVRATVEATLEDRSRSPVDRLHAYFDTVRGKLADADWRHGCLIGNMSLETAEHSDLLRERLAAVLDGVSVAFARVVGEGQAAGEIRLDFSAEDVASALMASWQGAMLRMKVERSSAPIDRFKRVTLAAFLTTPAAAPIDHARQPI